MFAAPSVGATTVDSGTPDASTRYIAAVRRAVPFGLPPDLMRAWYVHVPAGKDMPPVASTIQPLQTAGVAGTDADIVEFEVDAASPTPGENSVQPVAPAIGRLSACGSAAPVVVVLLSTYGTALAVPT